MCMGMASLYGRSLWIWRSFSMGIVYAFGDSLCGAMFCALHRDIFIVLGNMYLLHFDICADGIYVRG